MAGMSIGDLANDVAAALYEQRVAVAVLSIVGAVALFVGARRLGWFAAAARHPRRTMLVAALAFVVLAPVTWYLASPIFLRTQLVEPAPIGAVDPSISPAPLTSAPPSLAVDPTPIPASAVPTLAPTVVPSTTPTPFEAPTVATGAFQGTDEFHFGNGTASIIEIEPGRYHLRLEDFSVRNGPDLYVYLSPDASGYTKDSLEVGLLKATDGSFGYDLPDGIDPARFQSAIIWCKQFSHLFATAAF